ncbi:MAG: PAS domain S-box protein [Methanoregulaceae archaeon]
MPSSYNAHEGFSEHTQLVRYWVIAALSISCVLIAAIGVVRDPFSFYQQIFFIPIIYSAYYYPRWGILLAGALGLIYQTISYFVLYPDVNILVFITGQVIVFIIVASLVSLFSSRIRNEEQKYREIFENAKLGILLLNRDRRTILDANPYLEHLLRYEPGELKTVSFRDFFYQDADCHAFLQHIDRGDCMPPTETIFVTKNGDPVWVLLTCTGERGDGITCTAFDIRERKRVESALSDAETSQNTTLDAMGDAIFVVDPDYRIIHANRTFNLWCHQFVHRDDPLGKNPWEIAPEMKDWLLECFENIKKTPEVHVSTDTIRLGEREIDTETRLIPITENGEILRIVAVMRDISERRKAEQALMSSEHKYRQLADNSPVSIIITHHGIINYANPTFSRLTGYRIEELKDKKFSDLIHPDNLDEISEIMEKWESGKFLTTPDSIKILRKTGDIRRAELFVSSIQDQGEQAEMINLVDVTQQIIMEETLRGDLDRRRDIVTTVAHELRTPLQPIMGYLNLLMQDPEGFGLNEETQRIIALCLKNVDRERQIVNQMLELTILDSGKIRLQYSDFSIANLVSSVVEAGGYRLQGELENRIPPDVLIRADMDRLYVVMDSIISNAVKYSKTPRKILVTYNDEGDAHSISIMDNGIGIDEKSLNHIFEPFHLADAAKLSRKYERIGLSLSIAKKYIQLHGGDIQVRSTVGEGSTFSLIIPKESPQ